VAMALVSTIKYMEIKESKKFTFEIKAKHDMDFKINIAADTIELAKAGLIESLEDAINQVRIWNPKK